MARDHARLLAVFRRVLLLSAGLSASAEACGDGTAGGRPDAARDDESDATTDDALAAQDAKLDGVTMSDASEASHASDADAAPGASFPTCDDASAGKPYFVDGASCYYYVDFSCPRAAPIPNDCVIPAAACLGLCPLDAGILECRYVPSSCAAGALAAEAGEPVTVACGICAQGRRPAGLTRERRAAGASLLGAYFAQAAHLEAASVFAFRQLQTELRALGAPRPLVDAARRAADDEGRHARSAQRLARRFGAEPPAVRVRRGRRHNLEVIARENAVEGCVRETFGAVVATWQAEHARDPAVRRHMARIATDETRHAALAWAVDRWAVRKLDPKACARVARAKRRAVERLAAELQGHTPAELPEIEAGLPEGRDARTWHRVMSDELWLYERSARPVARAMRSGSRAT